MMMETDVPPALGTIVDEGRGTLPYQLIHGESLVACAAWGLGEAHVIAVDLGTQWPGVDGSEEPFVVHDALCPMTPAGFIAECVARAVATGSVVVAVDAGGGVLSPVVLPGPVVERVPGLPSTDFPELVRLLEAEFPVERVLAPAAAARVTSSEELAALELLTAPEDA